MHLQASTAGVDGFAGFLRLLHFDQSTGTPSARPCLIYLFPRAKRRFATQRQDTVTAIGPLMAGDEFRPQHQVGESSSLRRWTPAQ